MPYNFSPFKAKTKEIEEWLKREMAGIRTGRATPALLDGVTVESYGSRLPLKQLGAVNIEDVRSLRVTLWDKSQMKEVESAISSANLGVSVSSDQASLRIIFPELTADKRQILQKVAHEKIEEARISLRKEREKVWNDIQTKEQAGEIPEDEKFRGKNDLQKLVDEANQTFGDIAKRKADEIMN